MDTTIKIPWAKPDIGKEEFDEIKSSFESNWFTLGPKVKLFEKQMANYCNAPYSAAVSNGTVALDIALKTIGISPGDEIIVPAMTYFSTASSVSYQNAVPVFVDIESETFNIDPSKIEKSITSKTKAIMPIHYAGQVCEMDEINEIAQKHNLHVVEDAAPAVGALYKGKKAGTLGNIAGFSFFPDKNMTTGEGGMIVTNDSELAETCQILKKNGASKRYYNTHIGWNFKMPDICAALGISQLKRIESIIDAKNLRAKIYGELLDSVKGITTPVVRQYNKVTYMLYSILTESLTMREKIRTSLEKHCIETIINFPSMHLQPAYVEKYGNKEGHLPVSEDMSERILGLPIFINMTQDQQELVARVIKESTS